MYFNKYHACLQKLKRLKYAKEIIYRKYHSDDVFGFKEKNKTVYVVPKEVLQNRNNESNFYRLVTAYRQHAHKGADINPVALTKNISIQPELDLERYGLTKTDKVSFKDIINIQKNEGSIEEAIEFLNQVYAKTIAVEFSHLENEEETEWFSKKIESLFFEKLDKPTKIRIATELLQSQAFDNFLANKFTGVKRYGGEGAESLMVFFGEFLQLSFKVHASPASPPQPQQAPFFNKMLWSSSLNKRDQELGMMPPPESSLVPISVRRPSLNLPSTSEVHSPPLRALKQEYIDENSQNSIDIHPEHYHHISESSLDVHHGDSNMSMLNDNSVDILRQGAILNHNENSNLSVSNDAGSVDLMVRRSSLSLARSVHDNSMDVNLSNSQMSEDSTCSTVMHHSSTIVTDRLVMSPSSVIPQNILSSVSQQHKALSTVEELKVMDLRMKVPMATVADLVSSNAPSMATLQSFAVTNGPLPTQSAQSVENFLTKIESKPITLENSLMQLKNNPTTKLNNNGIGESEASVAVLQKILTDPILNDAEPVYLSSDRPFLPNESDNVRIVAKSEAAAVAEPTGADQNPASLNAMSTLAPSSLRALPTPINTEKLDALVNSTVDSHIGSPQAEVSATSDLTLNAQSDLIITSRDVMLNSQSSLMVAPIINPSLSPPIMNSSPILNQSANLSPEVILNAQLSPNLMCRNNQDALLPPTTMNLCQNSAESSLIPISNQNSSLLVSSEPEKVVLLKAAVDLLETQKKISELEQSLPNSTNSNNSGNSNNKIMDDIIIMATATTTSAEILPSNRLGPIESGGFVHQSNLSGDISSGLILNNKDNKSDFVIPVPVKDIAPIDVKNEDRMIPQSFTSLTENELINLMNPSCFDQV